MADEKPKAPAPAAPVAPPKDYFREGVEIIIVLLVLSAVATAVTSFFQRDPLFQNGWRGLTRHGIILAYTRPIASLVNPINANILASNDPTAVLNDAGGLVIGSQNFGARGRIIQGPVEVGGVNYYNVDFDKDPDGWVAENRIAYRDGEPTILARLILHFWEALAYIKWTLFLLSAILFYFLVRLVRRLTKLRQNNIERLYPAMMAVENLDIPQVNPQWQRVMGHVESANENDWRLAIIEADIMLSELLGTMSLQGDSIGEKLKGVEPADFTTIQAAWEAHKVRNQIAHEGANFLLNQREARRVVSLYEEVFKEFQFI